MNRKNHYLLIVMLVTGIILATAYMLMFFSGRIFSIPGVDYKVIEYWLQYVYYLIITSSLIFYSGFVIIGLERKKKLIIAMSILQMFVVILAFTIMKITNIKINIENYSNSGELLLKGAYYLFYVNNLVELLFALSLVTLFRSVGFISFLPAGIKILSIVYDYFLKYYILFEMNVEINNALKTAMVLFFIAVYVVYQIKNKNKEDSITEKV